MLSLCIRTVSILYYRNRRDHLFRLVRSPGPPEHRVWRQPGCSILSIPIWHGRRRYVGRGRSEIAPIWHGRRRSRLGRSDLVGPTKQRPKIERVGKIHRRQCMPIVGWGLGNVEMKVSRSSWGRWRIGSGSNATSGNRRVSRRSRHREIFVCMVLSIVAPYSSYAAVPVVMIMARMDV